MFPLKLMKILVPLVAGFALTGITTKGEEKDCEKTRDHDLEKLLYDFLKNDGLIVHPGFPYEIYCQKVEGKKIHGIQILHRHKTKNKYDLAACASEGEFRVFSVRGRLLAWFQLERCRTCFVDGSTSYFEKKRWEIELPAKWQSFRNPSPKVRPPAVPWIKKDEKKFLEEEILPMETGDVDFSLKKFFGEDCPEIKKDIKLLLKSKNMILASDHFDNKPDGRILLKPCSLVRFSDNGKFTAVRSHYAYLTLDGPIHNLAELGSRKILSVELAGGMVLKMDGR